MLVIENASEHSFAKVDARGCQQLTLGMIRRQGIQRYKIIILLIHQHRRILGQQRNSCESMRAAALRVFPGRTECGGVPFQ